MDILLASIDANTAAFIRELQKKCIQKKICLKIERKNFVTFPIGGLPVSGYFTDLPPTLAVAVDKSFEQWLRVIVHESCHMDQYLEQSRFWTEPNTAALFFQWLEKQVDLEEKNIKECAKFIRDGELDCEKRSVEKIKNFNLPFDTRRYAQLANSYLWFYAVVSRTRKWYTPGREPYNVEAIVSRMPTHFDNDYDKMPSKELYELYLDILK